MATEALIQRLLDAQAASAATAPDEADTSTVETLHALLDDTTIEIGERTLSVSEAATLLGLSAHTLRYYEGLGLVRPGRTSAGYRAYSAAELRRLVFITRMRVAGMTMQDLTRYIALVNAGESTVPERRRLMLEQRERILQRQRELRLALEATEFKIRSYGGAPSD